MATEFEKELSALINKYSGEQDSNTPDFILAAYLSDCLLAFNKATAWRSSWYSPGQDCQFEPAAQPATTSAPAFGQGSYADHMPMNRRSDLIEPSEEGMSQPAKHTEKENHMDGLLMKYFVLKPAGNDRYAAASRRAMRAYADFIQAENPVLSDQLRDWARREGAESYVASMEAKDGPDGTR